jgi:hypothetical protein
MGIEGDKREERIENLFKEIISENFPKLWQKVDKQIHEVQIILNRINLNKSTLRPIIIKLSRVNRQSQMCWCTAIIPDTWKVEIGRISV